MTNTPDLATPARPAAPHADARLLSPVSRWLLYPVAVLVVVVITYSFILSFQAQVELAIDARIPADVAYGWPIIVDGTVLIATVSAVILQPRGRSVSWYPWAILILFGSLSIFVNALHAIEAEPEQYVLTVISATPAVGLLLSTHLLVVLLAHRGKQKPDLQAQDGVAETLIPAAEATAPERRVEPPRAPRIVTPTEPLPRAAPPAASAHPASTIPPRPLESVARAERATDGDSAGVTVDVPEEPAPARPAPRRSTAKPASRSTVALTRDQTAEKVRETVRTGGQVTGADVGSWMKVSPTRGQKILDSILTDTEAAA